MSKVAVDQPATGTASVSTGWQPGWVAGIPGYGVVDGCAAPVYAVQSIAIVLFLSCETVLATPCPVGADGVQTSVIDTACGLPSGTGVSSFLC